MNDNILALHPESSNNLLEKVDTGFKCGRHIANRATWYKHRIFSDIISFSPFDLRPVISKIERLKNSQGMALECARELTER